MELLHDPLHVRLHREWANAENFRCFHIGITLRYHREYLRLALTQRFREVRGCFVMAGEIRRLQRCDSAKRHVDLGNQRIDQQAEPFDAAFYDRGRVKRRIRLTSPSRALVTPCTSIDHLPCRNLCNAHSQPECSNCACRELLSITGWRPCASQHLLEDPQHAIHGAVLEHAGAQSGEG